MRIVIDMNLTPQRVEVFERHGFEAVHWQQVGARNAPDREIMQWARDNGDIVFTHDLDFGAILAATGADAPSVIQVRTQDVAPSHLETIISRSRNRCSLRRRRVRY